MGDFEVFFQVCHDFFPVFMTFSKLLLDGTPKGVGDAPALRSKARTLRLARSTLFFEVDKQLRKRLGFDNGRDARMLFLLIWPGQYCPNPDELLGDLSDISSVCERRGPLDRLVVQ